MKYNHFKHKMRAFVAVLAMFALGMTANAQQMSVSGIVKDAKTGEPILGASILEKGTNNGVITNFEGAFTISVASKSTLVVRYLGYLSEEVPVSGKNTLVIQLKEDAIALGEVVAIGYGTVRKNDATGSITAIKPDKLNRGLTTNAQDMLTGKIAGVSVISGGGTPGGGATIRIRGGSSLNASNDPLIVIDGLALDNDGIKGVANFLSTINPNDIETFSVLKDASATAIYGSRASNGVILITTKKGETGGRVRVSYDGNMSVSAIGKTLQVMNATDFSNYVKKLYAADQPDVVAKMGKSNTDWQSQIFQNAVSTDHNINISGGIKKLPYRVSFGYTDQNGIIKTSSFERYTGAISVSPSLFDDHLKINLNAKGMLVRNRYADGGVVGAALAMDPTQPVMGSGGIYPKLGGYWEWTQTDAKFGTIPVPLATRNPVSTLMQKNDVANSQDIIASAEFDYKVHFLPELRLHLNLGMDQAYGNQTTDLPVSAASVYPFGSTGWSKENKNNSSLNYYMQYAKELANSKFDVMGGYEWQHFHRNGSSASHGLTDLSGLPVVNGNYFNPQSSIFATESYLLSFFGRANYSFADKYLLTVTVRNDRSSRFSANNRSAVFPAFAFAWKINNEDFLKDNANISDLKLRLGYGVTGQQNLLQGDYPYLPVYTTSIAGANYPFGTTYNLTSRPDAYNPNLKWEQTATYNAGLDFGFFNSRITGSIDYYDRNTTDLINVVSVPAGTNFRNTVISNVGSLKNKGLEFSINAKAIARKDFTWEIGYNVTYNNNQITKLTTGNQPGYIVPAGGLFQGFAQAQAVGYPINSYYVYQQVYGVNGKPIEGLYVDRNGDGIVNEKDKYFFHNSNPNVTMGLSSKIIYKKFDLGFTLRASIGNYIYNGVAAGNLNVGAGGVYSSLGYLSNKLMSAFDTNFTGKTNDYLSDYYVQNASFLRCDNISFGYSFKKLFGVIDSGRIFATVQNPFVITKYKGLDPEISGGIDNNIYPRPIITLMGLTLNF
ncbi:MAG: TonB-dependent receptor [Paludibacter sp.]|nr:TonB-dependent receptor [Paludibacter sp.]